MKVMYALSALQAFLLALEVWLGAEFAYIVVVAVLAAITWANTLMLRLLRW